MSVLENENVRLTLDENGNLSELVNVKTGHNYASGGVLWRLYFQKGDLMDREIFGCDVKPQVTQEADSLTLYYPSVKYQGGDMAVAVTVVVKLVEDETRWSISIENNEDDIILRECMFPLINGLELKPEQSLLWSSRGGQKIRDIPAEIRKTFSMYKASDHVFLHTDLKYPGMAAMNCYLFEDEEESLYCACYDDTFTQSLHSFRLYGEKLECGFARYPSLNKGEKCTIGGFVLSPHCGDWRVGAKKYRKWADSWFKHQTPPEWVRKLKGWQRIILKHQYGEVHYRYDDLPEIHEDGLSAGIDSLHMFGWWQGGMDNSNPDYLIDDALGGEKVLKDNIEKFQQNGSVILYSNGRLIDLNTDYYKTVGKRISVKDKFGAEVRDAYRFRANGTYTGHFGNRTFSAACPFCDEWLDKMKEVVDIAIKLGCMGVFFDQLGMDELPCFDESHGHEVPNMQMAFGKAELTRKLRDYVREKAPGMAIGIECLSDVSSQNCDFIHSFPGFNTTLNDWEAKGEKPVMEFFIDFFRYMFPEIIMTDREIRDDTDVERRVNHALLKGLRSDVEIYRCRKTIKETPHYQKYLKKANDLREKYSELIVEGDYTDRDGFVCDNDEVDARSFVAGNKMAVIVAQSHLAGTSANLQAEGFRFVECGGLGEFKAEGEGAAVKLNLPRHALAVVVFEKA